MQQFVALISTPAATMQKWMESTDEATRNEQMGKMMTEWEAWKTEHAASIVHEGLPLGKTKKVTASGVTDSKNDLNYFMIVQAEDADAAAQIFVSNPHLTNIPDSYVEVMGTQGPKPE